MSRLRRAQKTRAARCLESVFDSQALSDHTVSDKSLHDSDGDHTLNQIAHQLWDVDGRLDQQSASKYLQERVKNQINYRMYDWYAGMLGHGRCCQTMTHVSSENIETTVGSRSW